MSITLKLISIQMQLNVLQFERVCYSCLKSVHFINCIKFEGLLILCRGLGGHTIEA